MSKIPPSYKVCVVGGSGFYNFLPNAENIVVKTPFGEVNLNYQDRYDYTVYFLPRHGGKHSIPPHRVNYKANVFALHSLGVQRVLATNAVGSLKKSLNPGDYVILDQFIDLVRPITFFEDGFEVYFPQGSKLSGVVHVDMTEPYCSDIRTTLINILQNIAGTHNSGTYVTTMGPRFETGAEIKVFQQLGADVVGMTNSSEAILCRELGICYGAIAVITNMAAGLQEYVDHQEVLDIFDSRSRQLNDIFNKVLNDLPREKSCTCKKHIS
ncbi:MAG: S-methyl-5'-thioadenosine phosphorylase [Candidatus Thorarchaeota archaeon]